MSYPTQKEVKLLVKKLDAWRKNAYVGPVTASVMAQAAAALVALDVQRSALLAENPQAKARS